MLTELYIYFKVLGFANSDKNTFLDILQNNCHIDQYIIQNPFVFNRASSEKKKNAGILPVQGWLARALLCQGAGDMTRVVESINGHARVLDQQVLQGAGLQ